MYRSYENPRALENELKQAQPEVLVCGSGELVQESDDLVKDCISRQDAIDAHCELCPDQHICCPIRNGNICPDIEVFRLLPSAQRKKGKWIDGRCSICGCDIPAYIIDWKWQKDMDANYCPSCGADMRGESDEMQ